MKLKADERIRMLEKKYVLLFKNKIKISPNFIAENQARMGEGLSQLISKTAVITWLLTRRINPNVFENEQVVNSTSRS